MSPVMDGLHWLRPDWLWALLALPLLAWWWQRRRRRANVWCEAVDAHLLAHLLDQRVRASGRLALVIAALGYALAVLALAGPSWRQGEQPLWQGEAPLVVALDLSSASLAGDLPPSRLAQARAKLATLLRERTGGQVGLVAYAGAPFTVAPLTDDATNVALFLDALHPDVMPIDGQRGDRAIRWSAKLLQQAGFKQGRILLLTDHADAASRAAAETARGQGYTVSILGLGTVEGAPYQGRSGTIASARLDEASLRQLAAAGGGRYAVLAGDDADLQALGVLDPADAGTSDAGTREPGTQALSRQDGGFWLLMPLMVLALLAFRRGAPLMLLVLCLWLPGRGVHAAEVWQRADQLAHQRMERAAQAYRDGDYPAAANLYGGLDDAEADYNRGNALAKAGRYAEAIEAYQQALRRNPSMADATANKQAVEAALQRQPKSPENPGDQDQGGNDQDKPGERGQDQGGPGGDKQGQGQPEQQADDGQPQDGDEGGEPEQSDARQDGEASQRPADESGSGQQPAQTAGPADAQAQQAADQAQHERMQQALEQARAAGEGGKPAPQPAAESPQQRERRIANEAWLQRVPDDPGGLLREKFRIEYQRRQLQGVEE